MLVEVVEAAVGEGRLASQAEYAPFPRYEAREAWAKLPERARSYLIGWADARKDEPWPILSASRYLEFVKNGNRSRFEAQYFARHARLYELAMAECAQGQGRYWEAVVDGLWALMEESTWVLPAHNRRLDDTIGGLPDLREGYFIDLFSAESGALLAVIAWIFEKKLDETSPILMQRARDELKKRIFDPFLAREDMFWMGLQGQKVNNWNPWIVSNVLTSALLMETGARRCAIVCKCARCAEAFLDGYAEDGGCDEGPSYFSVAGASMLDILEILHTATGGRVSLYEEAKIRCMAEYILHAHISDQYVMNFADAPNRVTNTPAHLLYRAARSLGSEALERFAARAFASGCTQPPWMPAEGTICCPYRAVRNLFTDLPEDEAYEAPAGHYYPGVQVAVARSREFFFAAKGGCNAESHNHNDVGSFILYRNGRPVLVDAGVGAYTKQTFSEHRYDIWSMTSRCHSTLLVNGCEQPAGESYAARDAACEDDGQTLTFRLDLAPAYPEKAKALRCVRTFAFDRASQTLTLRDELALEACDAPTEVTLLLADKPELRGNGALLSPEGERVALDWGEGFDAALEARPLDDARMRANWGRETLWTLTLRRSAPACADAWTLRFTP